jgi:hypothetical protein
VGGAKVHTIWGDEVKEYTKLGPLRDYEEMKEVVACSI